MEGRGDSDRESTLEEAQKLIEAAKPKKRAAKKKATKKKTTKPKKK